MWTDLKGASLFAIALACRAPFLWAGYGKEFDAWSNALNARIISETGIYEVSRLPGHPLQELMLSGIWFYTHSYFIFNAFSALFSAIAVWAFFEILRFHKIERAWYWAIAFNFIPVFFIAGTYTIDYNFALAFILMAYLALLREQYLLVGVFVGVATGFRISSLAFLAPFALLLGWQFKALLKMGLAAVVVAAVCFYLPFATYGWAFLDFHKPPFPGWASVFYKLGIGIWGLPLLLFMLVSAIHLIRRPSVVEKPAHLKGLAWPWFLGLVIALQLAVFLRLPFKAEFFIPALPFILIAWAAHNPGSWARYAAYVSMASCLFFGFDYKSPWRGAEPLDFHWSFEAGGKTIFCSPLQGPISIDQSKRRVRSQTVLQSIEVLQESAPSLVVAGWYLPELVLRYPEGHHLIEHYASEAEIDSAQMAGLRILYLPEIEDQNVLMEGHPKLEQEGQALLSP